MSFRPTFCRILRPRSLRSHSTVENRHASAASHTDFMDSGNGALWIDRQSHIYSCHSNRAAITNGLQSLRWTGITGYHPSYASGTCAIHGITFSNYQQSGKIQGLNSKASLEFKRVSSRFFSGGPDLPFPVLGTLIGANVAVFTMWYTLNYQFMNRHFTVSVDSVLSGRLHTILTSAFSHRDMGHLLSNLIGLYFFGSAISRNFGGQYLLTLYLAGAIGGSVGHMLYYAYAYPWLKGIPHRLYNKRYSPGALGASGAVTTVVLLYIFLYPMHTVLFYMVIPMPCAVLGAIMIGWDLFLAKRGGADVSLGGHLGGGVVAFLAFLAKRGYWF